MRKVRWGIISAGNIAGQFVRDFDHVEGAQIHAVAARDVERARAFAREHGITHAYSSYDALYSDPNIDAVYIATPHNLHYPHAAAALRAGKAVLCEKPLTVNERECAELFDLAERENGYLMEAMWTYCLPAVRRAKQWVEEGRIGRICHIKADFGYPLAYRANRREYDATLAGGCLLEMGVYPVAIAWYFMGRDPREIQVIDRHAPNGVEDDLAIHFDYDNAVASLSTSFRCKLPNVAWIIGDKGTIVIPDFWRAHECALHVLDEKVDHYTDGRDCQGFAFEAQAVTDDFRAKRAGASLVTREDSLAFARHMDAVRAGFQHPSIVTEK